LTVRPEEVFMKVRTANEDLELRNKKLKKNRKKIKRFVFLMKFILTVSLLVTTVVLFALSPLFAVKKIEVRGAAHYTAESLISLSGVIEGENGFKQVGSSLGSILTLRIGSAEQAISRGCPYVKAVNVKYVLPGSVIIDVVERTAAAAVPYTGTSLLVDREGFVLEEQPPDAVQKLPYIKGLKFGSYEPGKKPEYENYEALQVAFRVLDEIRGLDKNEAYALYDRVDSIDVSDPDAVVFSLESRLRVKLGDMQDLNYKLSSAKTIFERNIKKTDKGILDFTSGENPVFTPESGG
jgi:cell division protein FtsQ